MDFFSGLLAIINGNGCLSRASSNFGRGVSPDVVLGTCLTRLTLGTCIQS